MEKLSGYLNRILGNVTGNARDIQGNTPLISAVMDSAIQSGSSDHIPKIKRLIENGCDLNGQNNYQLSALDYAVATHNRQIIQLLIESGADLNLQSKNGITPLVLAITDCRLDIAQILIDKGCDVNIVDKDNQTALFHFLSFYCMKFTETMFGPSYCCSFDMTDFGQKLLNKGADPNIGKSVLQATRFPCKTDMKHVMALQILILHGLKIDIYATNSMHQWMFHRPRSLIKRLFRKDLTMKFMDLVYLTGSCPQSHFFYLFRSRDMEPILQRNPSKRQWLKEKCSNPMTLKNLTRMVIFRNVRPSKMINIDKLPIAESSKKFLKFGHIHDHVFICEDDRNDHDVHDYEDDDYW